MFGNFPPSLTWKLSWYSQNTLKFCKPCGRALHCNAQHAVTLFRTRGSLPTLGSIPISLSRRGWHRQRGPRWIPLMDEECPSGWCHFQMISVHQWGGPCPRAEPGVLALGERVLPIATEIRTRFRGRFQPRQAPRPAALSFHSLPSTHRNLRHRNWCRTGEILSISIARSNSFTISCKASLLAFLVLWNLGDIWRNFHFF